MVWETNLSGQVATCPCKTKTSLLDRVRPLVTTPEIC